MLKDIVDILEKAKVEIQSNLEQKGINASGRTSASFHVETYPNGARLVMGGEKTAPLQTLEVGRPGGNVPKGFTAILEQWSRDKGIPFNTDRERRTFAYFLGKRIKEEGTLRNKAHVDVYSSVVTKAAEQIKKDIVVSMTAFIHSGFIK